MLQLRCCLFYYSYGFDTMSSARSQVTTVAIYRANQVLEHPPIYITATLRSASVVKPRERPISTSQELPCFFLDYHCADIIWNRGPHAPIVEFTVFYLVPDVSVGTFCVPSICTIHDVLSTFPAIIFLPCYELLYSI